MPNWVSLTFTTAEAGAFIQDGQLADMTQLSQSQARIFISTIWSLPCLIHTFAQRLYIYPYFNIFKDQIINKFI